MDASKTLDYLNDWLGEDNLNRIITKYDNIRAVFNDSLELSTDTLRTTMVCTSSPRTPTNNGLGYDFSKYLPMVYTQNLGAAAYRPANTMSGLGPLLHHHDDRPSVKAESSRTTRP